MKNLIAILLTLAFTERIKIFFAGWPTAAHSDGCSCETARIKEPIGQAMLRRSILGFIYILFLFTLTTACTQPTMVVSRQLPTNTTVPATQMQPLPTDAPLPSATPTPLPRVTPTILPLAQKELALVGITGKDLPSEFTEIMVTTNIEDMENFFDDFDSSNINNCYLSLYEASEPERLIFSAIWIYANEFIASKAYSTWSEANSMNQSIVEVPLMGSEVLATIGEDNAFIIWRYQEAVAFVIIGGDQRPDVDEVVRLAQLVQKRMDEQQVARLPTPTIKHEAPNETQPPLLITEVPITPPTEHVEVGMGRSNPYPVGEVVHTPYWEFYVVDMLRGDAAWQAIFTANPETSPAPEGREYLAVKINVKCLSNDNKAHSIGDTDFYATGDRNELYGGTTVLEPRPIFVSHELYRGEEAEGWVTYLIDKDEKKLIMVFKKLTDSYDELIIRFVALEEGASVTIPADLSNIQPNNLGMEMTEPDPFGEKVITENWEATVLEMVRGDEAWKMIQAANSFINPPNKNGEYIAVRVHVRYIGTIDQVIDRLDQEFGILDNQNIQYDTSSIYLPGLSLYADLYPGGEAEGWVIFEVPRGESNLRLVFPTFTFRSDGPRYLSLEK